MRQPDRQAAYGKLAKERSGENKKMDAAKMAQEFWERQQNHTITTATVAVRTLLSVMA